MNKLIIAIITILLGSWLIAPPIISKWIHRNDEPTKHTDFILGDVKNKQDVKINTEFHPTNCAREIYEIEYRCIEDTCTFNVKFN